MMDNIEELNRLIKESKDISGIIDEVKEVGKGLFEQLRDVNIKSRLGTNALIPNAMFDSAMKEFYDKVFSNYSYNTKFDMGIDTTNIEKLLTPLLPDHPNQFKWFEPNNKIE